MSSKDALELGGLPDRPALMPIEGKAGAGSGSRARAIMLPVMEGLNGISDQLIQVAILILVLAGVWFAARLVLRLTIRIFTTGCFVILAVGLCILAFRVLG